MEEPAPAGKDNEKKSKTRFMGKLFKDKDKSRRVAAENEGNVDDFLHGPPSDKLQHMPLSPAPLNSPPLSRIDTTSARRWPTAAVVNASQMPRRRSASPKRSRKGLAVRFTEDQPEVIGEGGDEATSPVADIGARRRAHTHPTARQPAPEPAQPDARSLRTPSYGPGEVEEPGTMDNFRPKTLSRTQTAYESLSENSPLNNFGPNRRDPPAQNFIYEGGMSNDLYDPTSFAARVRAEMRSGEGKALVQASLDVPDVNQRPDLSEDLELTPQLRELRINTMRNSYISSPSTNSIPTQLYSGAPIPTAPQKSTSTAESPAQFSCAPTMAQKSTPVMDGPPTLSRASTFQGAALAMADDALHEFSSRVTHLFTLFRLSTEAVKPLPQCSLEELMRVALWWFLKGRMDLEAAVRERPASPQAQQRRMFVLQQAHANLAKSLWIVETVLPQRPEFSNRYGPDDPDSELTRILESRQDIISSLRKLTMSMKRNGFLPPDSDESPLLQGLDNSVWVRDEGDRSLVATQRQNTSLSLSESFPLGDSAIIFHFGRMFVDGLLEEESGPHTYRCPILLSLVRSQKDKNLVAMVSSQDGVLKLCISSDSNSRPTWEDVAWQPKTCSLKVQLPRGLSLRLRCSESDFRIFWGLFDYQTKVHASLDQRRNEELVFETIVKSFQYIDPNPDSRFPKEALPTCHFRLFEKIKVERAASGTRTFHLGFRVALNTHPKTKTLRGIDQEFPPSLPLQFGFLRGEDGLPAMLLRVEDSKSNYKMVLTFDDGAQRKCLHEILTGTALGYGQDFVAEAPMKAFSIAGSSSKDLNCLKTLDWQGYRVINEDGGELESNTAVLSEHLRVALDFKTGSLTDRINVGTGELKLRLDVKSPKQLIVFRKPQQDMTLSVVESQVSHELPHELADVLNTVASSPSIRTYLFASLQDLHLFQAAITGFVVLYDGNAASFNIARRRMVVPIYKKWDAMTTRLQIVRREKIVQLLAFFEGFSHGDCMNFTLKSTDIFETSGKSGKYLLRIVDAKFALPKASSKENEETSKYVCLDMPEYPGEHDDITIIFDSESERDKFTQCLPAPVKVASRMGSVRR